MSGRAFGIVWATTGLDKIDKLISSEIIKKADERLAF